MSEQSELAVSIRFGDDGDDMPWDFLPHPEIGDLVYHDEWEYVVTGRAWTYHESEPTLTYLTVRAEEPSE